MVANTFINPSKGRQISKVKVSLVYRVSTRTGSNATQRNPVFKKPKEKKGGGGKKKKVQSCQFTVSDIRGARGLVTENTPGPGCSSSLVTFGGPGFPSQFHEINKTNAGKKELGQRVSRQTPSSHHPGTPGHTQARLESILQWLF